MMSSELKRRTFLGNASSLMGTAAFAKLLSADSPAAALPPSPPGLPHFAPKAKRVIYLFLAGGPSHIDLFDYKPALKKIDGQPLPESVRQGQRLTTMTSGQSEFLCVAPKFNFERCGERGTWINTDLLPQLSTVADELAIIRSMHTEAINHDPAITYINTGSQQHGRPSFGSWISYGLGSPNSNLPAYVVMISVGWGAGQALYTRLGEAGACRPVTREFSFAASAIRYFTSLTLPASTGICAGGCSTDLPTLTKRNTSAPAIPKLRPASRSMKWRSACRLPCLG